MKCFLGVLPARTLPFERLMERSRFLPVSVLHFSLEGGVGLCKGDALGDSSLILGCGRTRWYAVGERSATGEEEALRPAYSRFGKKCASRLAENVAFAVWDKRKGCLTLGGTGEERAFVSEERDGLWFSSVADVLFHPVAVTLGVFPLFTQGRK